MWVRHDGHGDRGAGQVDGFIEGEAVSLLVGGAAPGQVLVEGGRNVGHDAFGDQDGCYVWSADALALGLGGDLIEGDFESLILKRAHHAHVPIVPSLLQLDQLGL